MSVVQLCECVCAYVMKIYEKDEVDKCHNYAVEQYIGHNELNYDKEYRYRERLPNNAFHSFGYAVSVLDITDNYQHHLQNGCHISYAVKRASGIYSALKAEQPARERIYKHKRLIRDKNNYQSDHCATLALWSMNVLKYL